jgi:hypothetical protein
VTGQSSGGGAGPGWTEEVIDLADSSSGEEAAQQPKKRGRAASGEDVFLAVDDKQARAPQRPHISAALRAPGDAMSGDTRWGGLDTRAWAWRPQRSDTARGRSQHLTPANALRSQSDVVQPAEYLLVGHDSDRGKNQEVLRQRLADEYGILCVTHHNQRILGAILCAPSDVTHAQVALYKRVCVQPNILYMWDLLDPRRTPSGGASRGSGGGARCSSGLGGTPGTGGRGHGGQGGPSPAARYSSPPPPNSGGRGTPAAPAHMPHGSGGAGGGGAHRGVAKKPMPKPQPPPSPLGSAPHRAPAPTQHAGGYCTGARGFGAGASPAGGVGGGAPSGALVVAFDARADFEFNACSFYAKAISRCPKCDADLRVYAVRDAGRVTGHIVRGTVGPRQPSSRRCCGRIENETVLGWVLENGGPWSTG